MNKSVQFETSKPEFVKVLRKRVNAYFKDNNIEDEKYKN